MKRYNLCYFQATFNVVRGEIAIGIDTLSEGDWGLSNTAETFIRWKSEEGKGKLVTFQAPSLVKLYVCTELRIYHFAVSLINKVMRLSGSHYLSNGLLVFFNPGDLLASMIFFNCLRQLGSDSLNSRYPAPHRPPLQRSHMRRRYREPAGTGQEIQSLT